MFILGTASLGFRTTVLQGFLVNKRDSDAGLTILKWHSVTEAEFFC